MKVAVIFTVDFATKKKGDIYPVDSLIASTLVHFKKVAKYYTAEAEEIKVVKPIKLKKNEKDI